MDHDDLGGCKFIPCGFTEYGCTAKGTRSNLKMHIAAHTYGPYGCRFIPCNFIENGCEYKGNRANLKIHMGPSGGCRFLPCNFIENGCEYRGTRATLEVHMGGCKFKDIKCPDWGCQIMMPMKEVVAHLQNAHARQTWPSALGFGHWLIPLVDPPLGGIT